jgi:bacterioferritin-associated ferredoxin
VYVCLCRAVTDKDIKQAVDDGHRNVAAVRDRLGVGTGCGRCREYAAELIRRLADSSERPFYAV